MIAVGVAALVATIPAWARLGLVIGACGLGLLAWRGPRHARLGGFALAGAFAVAALVPAVPVALLGAIAVISTSRSWRPTFAASTTRARLVLWTGAVSVAAATGVAVWWSTVGGLMLFRALPDRVMNEPAAGAAFVLGGAVVNAIFEEGLWRRQLATGLEGVGTWSHRAALIAVLFGAAHFFALPSGWFGVVLTAAFSFAASWLVRLGGGRILPAIVAHTLADAVLLAVAVGLLHVP